MYYIFKNIKVNNNYLVGLDVDFIIFFVIIRYSSGTNPWVTSNNEPWSMPTFDDGLLEVIGCFTSTLVSFLKKKCVFLLNFYFLDRLNFKLEVQVNVFVKLKK